MDERQTGQPGSTPPGYGKPAFDCPHCHVYSRQSWQGVYLKPAGYDHLQLSVAVCENCGESTVWWERKLIYPVEPKASTSASN